MLSEFRKRKLARLFSAFDGDQDGVLTNADPAHVIANLTAVGGLEEGSQEHELFSAGFMAYWKDFIMTSDADDDGRVTLDEWWAYHAEMLEDEGRFQATAAMSAGVMFALVDRNRDGQISLEEYRQWLLAWQVEADQVTDELLARLDVDGTGQLTQARVLALTREFFYSEDPDAPGNWCMGPF